MIRFARDATMLLTLISLFAGCEKQRTTTSAPATSATSRPQPQSLPVIKMIIGNRQFQIEVAKEDEAQHIGLMYRDSMNADHGMIFVFPDEQPRAFWMKNVRFPLDILYLDRDGRVVSIKQMRPYDVSDVPSDRPAQYAIELNDGAAAAAGVKIGDVIQIPAQLPAAAATRPIDR
jgi:uncharacterized protein